MYPLFNYGVIRKSEQLTRLSFKIDRLVQGLEQHRQVKQFAGKHPAALKRSIKSLQQARMHVFLAMRDLNFPDEDQGPLLME
jgi:hypothetical protein